MVKIRYVIHEDTQYSYKLFGREIGNPAPPGVEMEGINVASVMASARPNEGQPAIFVIKFRSVLLTTVSLMVFSFVFCILWTLKYNQVGKT